MTFEEVMNALTIIEVKRELNGAIITFAVFTALAALFVYFIIKKDNLLCPRPMAILLLVFVLVVDVPTALVAIPQPLEIAMLVTADTKEIGLADINQYFSCSDVSIGDETLVCVVEPRHSFIADENYYKATGEWLKQRKGVSSESVER